MNIVSNLYEYIDAQEFSIEAEEAIELNFTKPVVIIVRIGEAILNNSMKIMKSTVFMSNQYENFTIKNINTNVFVCRIFTFQTYSKLLQENNQLLYKLNNQPEEFLYHQLSSSLRQLSDQLFFESNLQQKSYLLMELMPKLIAEYEQYKEVKLPENFQEVLDYIFVNSHRDVKREQVANYFGYHPNYFSELIKKETGWSYTDFLAHVRIDKAKLLLLNPKSSITSVAQEVGYNDGAYFTKKFRKQTGQSPKEFRALKERKRIFTFQFTGSLLACKIKPIGTTDWLSNIPPKELQKIMPLQIMSEHGEEQLRILQQLDLDMILVPTYLYTHPSLIEALEKIAPVFIVGWDQLDRLEEVRLIGQITNKAEAAESWIEHFVGKAATYRKEILAFVNAGETFGVYELQENEEVSLWRVSARGAYNIYKLMHLPVPKKIQRDIIKPNKHKIISEYLIEQYKADHMLVAYHDEAQLERLKQAASWKDLQAQGKKIYPIRVEDFWASEGIFLEKQLDLQFEKIMQKKYLI